MTNTSTLAAALADVPDLLLGDRDRVDRKQALATLDELASLVVEPSKLVVIGGGGSGKSSVSNALVGSDVVVVSAVRPTTTGVTVIGRSSFAPMEGVVEYVFTDQLHDGVVVVDTPSWDQEREIVSATAAGAHTVVVVLTPARYADAVTYEVIDGLPETAKVVIVVNRLPSDANDSDDILDDIESTYDAPIVARVDEGGAFRLPVSLLDDIPIDQAVEDDRRLLARTAASLGRRIAGSVTASAVELGDVQRVLSEIAEPTLDSVAASVRDDWETTRDALVAATSDAVDRFDRLVAERSANDLAERIRDDLNPVDSESVGAQLDGWRNDTAAMFRRRSSTRWRRKAANVLLDRWSWILSIDVLAKRPRRVDRVMRGGIDATAAEGRQNLLAILDGPIRRRPDQWSAVVARIGSFRPGVLLAASDALDGGETADG